MVLPKAVISQDKKVNRSTGYVVKNNYLSGNK